MQGRAGYFEQLGTRVPVELQDAGAGESFYGTDGLNKHGAEFLPDGWRDIDTGASTVPGA